MRIGFSGFFLDRPMTGSGQYTLALLAAWSTMTGDEDEIVVFCPTEAGYRQAQSLLPDGRPSAIRLVRALAMGAGPWAKLWYEQVTVPLLSRRERVDTLHIPYFGPPLAAPCPRAVTVHDLIMMALPEHRGSWLVQGYTALAGLGARRAQAVLADSAYTRDDILRLLHLPVDRVHVVPLGGPPPTSISPETIAATRERYQVRAPYVLYMGGLDWRKNLGALFDAWAAIDGPWTLAVAGQPHSPSSLYPDWSQRVAELGITSRVQFLGWVQEEDKPALYAGAELFVYPSRYEGFGLPPLEAMAVGTPVLCSNASSLPEVVGDAALQFDPSDATALAGLMQQALSDSGLRDRLRRLGRERAACFPWRRTAEATLGILHDIVRSGPRP